MKYDGNSPLRIGVDLGGTKISAIIMGPDDTVIQHHRCAAPKNDYTATITAIKSLVEMLASVGAEMSIGIGMPGSICLETGLVQNANSTWLNAKPLKRDLETALGQPVRLANDANCFALSEAVDGSAVKAHSVFGAILGTGCGGGFVMNGRALAGHRGIAGEWGHTNLPLAAPDERNPKPCWCGRTGCMETWVSGPALVRHAGNEFPSLKGITSVEEMAALKADHDKDAEAAFARHTSRLARGLGTIINILDPEVIVLGGGLSNLAHLYADLPAAIAPHIFAADTAIDIRPPKHGDDSGVRGAARLWTRGKTQMN